MPKRVFIILIILCGIILTGCTSATPTPDPDGPILVGFDALPKALATIVLSPTPNAPQAQATFDSLRPTMTVAPATYTPTPTVYAGIFMGESTFTANSLLPAGTRPVALVTVPSTQKNQGGAGGSVPVAGNAPSAPTNCGIPVAREFASLASNPAVAQRLGCPTGNVYPVGMVGQSFQNGFMFWRDTKEIFALSTVAQHNGSQTDSFWRVMDSWHDALPANDPGLQPPAGLLQPVRGFGYAWRNNTSIRNSLGWALGDEQQFGSTWQNFERGWMMTSINGAVIAMVPLDGPPATTGIHYGP
jgi:hypothetical protein